MSEHQPDEAPTIRDVAEEPPAQSVAREKAAVGDQPDTGDLVAEDDAQ